MRNNNIKKMIIAALLTAIAVIIPLQFGILKIYIPPFSATIAAHVPMFVAMIISPKIGLIVGLGSTLGFAMTIGGVVALRASSHIIIGYVGGLLFQKYKNLKKPILFTAPLHGFLEALAIIPFGLGTTEMLLITFIGTILHHFVDGFITFLLVRGMSGKTEKNIYEVFFNKFIR